MALMTRPKTTHVVCIPETPGIYGLRIWVNTEDTELVNFFKLICAWGGPTDTRTARISTGLTRLELYEFPFGIAKNPIWITALERLNVKLMV